MQNFNQNLNQTGGDLMLAGINAASQAGGDVQKFMDQYGGAFPQVAQQAAQQATGAAQTLGGAIDSSSPSAFAQSFAPYAQQAAQQLGIDPTWVAAMAASESNYGNAPGNELFGIKALPGQPGTSLATHEGEYGGTNVNANFAAYNSPQDSVNAFVDLLKNHYPGAVGAQTLQDFVHGLKQGGYFTAAEPEYLGILQGIQNRIGGDVQSGLQNAQSTGQQAVNTVSDAAQSAVARTSQFAMGLSSGDAMAFCGPAAAMAFAETFGRNPTVQEAQQLAQQVGWNASQGMAGPSSEVALLGKLGIDAHLTNGVDWNTVASEAQSGNPVIIDTPGHYFYVDGYNADTGQLHLGTSATDLKAANGQSWFTPAQIPSLGMGDPRAAIFADHPLSTTSSVATSSPQAQSVQTFMSTNASANNSLTQQAQDTLDAVLNTGGDAVNGASNWLDQQKNSLSDALSNAGSTVSQTAQDLASSGAGQDVLQNILGPLLGMPPAGAAQTATSALPSDLSNLSPSDLLDLGMTPQGQDILNALSQGTQSGAGQQVLQNIVGPLLGMPPAGAVSPDVTPSGVGQDVLQNIVGPLLGYQPDNAVTLGNELATTGTANLGPLSIGPVPQDNSVIPVKIGGVDITRPYNADALVQALMPNAPGPVSAAASQLLNPINAFFGPTGPLIGAASGAGGELARQVAENLGGDPTAQLVAQLAGSLAGGLTPSAVEQLPALADLLTDPVLQAALRYRQPGEMEVNAALGGIPSLLGIGEQAPGGAERVLNEAGQVLSTTGAPMFQMYGRASGTDLMARALSALQDLPEEAQNRLVAQAQELTDAGAPASTVASRLQQWAAQETGPSALGQALADEAAARATAAPTTAAPAATSAQDLISRLAALRQQVENAPLTAREEIARLGTPAAETAATTAAEHTLTPNQAAQIADDIARGRISATGEDLGGTGGGGGRTPGAGGGAAGTSGAPPLQQGAVTTLQGSNLFDTLGRYIASALSPGDNLKPEVQQALQPFANLVGDAHGIDLLVERDMQRYPISGALGAEDGPGQQLLRTQFYNEATNRLIGDLRAQGLITPMTNRAIPAGWKVASENAASQLSKYAVHPDVAGPLRAIVDHTGFLHTNPIGQAISKTWGTAKQTIFTLSQMHTLTTALNAAFSSPETLGNMLRAFASPSFYEGMRSGKMADTFVNAAVKGGVTNLAKRAEATDVGLTLKNPLIRGAVQSVSGGVGGGAASYLAAKQAGLSDDDARNVALAGGAAAAVAGPTLTPKLTQALWERAMPMAKATAWQGLVDGGMDPQVAGRIINQRFGGLNYAQMGRNPNVQNALRVAIQAPDWLEAPIRQAGNLVGGGGAGETRAFLAKTMGGMAIATELTNYALTGHFTNQNQPGYQFMVEQQDPAGGYMHFGLFPPQYQTYINLINKSVATPSRTGTNLLNFVTARQPAPISAVENLLQTAAAGSNTGKLPYGVAKAGPVAAALSQFAPIGVSQVAEGTQQGGENLLGTIAMALAGLNPTYTNPAAPGGSSGGGASGVPASHLPSSASATRTTPRTPPAPKTARTR